MTEKATTFLDQNRTWVSWGTMITVLGVAIWVIQAVNGATNSVNILNTKLDNLLSLNTSRTNYVDNRLDDFEDRLRICEKLFK